MIGKRGHQGTSASWQDILDDRNTEEEEPELYGYGEEDDEDDEDEEEGDEGDEDGDDEEGDEDIDKVDEYYEEDEEAAPNQKGPG